MHRSVHFHNMVILLSMPLVMRCGGSDRSGSRNAGGSSGEAGTTSTASGGSYTGGSASGGATNIGGAMSMAGSGMMSMGGAGMMNVGGAGMTTGGDTGTTVVGPQAPVIDSVAPMSGLHVTWTNVTPSCDKIELMRNKDGGAFAVAYTLTGAATSQHDGSAMPPGTYCYRARCVLGAQTSAESNEKCGTP